MVKEIKEFVSEHKNNKGYIWKLAVSSAKADTQKTTLGMWWNVIRDIVFFVAYGAFMLLLRGRSGELDGMPILVYLFTGLVAWYMISDNLSQGVNCIRKNKGIFTKIKFPILIIPTYETIAIYLKRISSLILLAIILIVCFFVFDFMPQVNIIGVIYSLVASFIFGVSYNLMMSGFYTISKDFRELYKAINRIQFYFVPIFWSVQTNVAETFHNDILTKIMENLPFIHLVNSFRFSLTTGELPSLLNIAIFLAIVIVMFLIGCYVQYRLRRIYSDFI